MNATQTLIQAAAVLALAATFAPAAQANTAAEGVKCPAGTTARLSNGNKKLVCEFQERIERESICSPIVFNLNGDVTANIRIDYVTDGQGSTDMCRAITTGAMKPTQALLLPGDVQTQFTRDQRAGKDVFFRVKTSYKFPEGGPIYVGDASKGVVCPGGFDGDSRFDGRGMRCDRLETRRAVCDVGWTFDTNNGVDKCFIEQVVFGNRVRVDGQYTIPEGTTGITGNPENHGWDLKVDHNGSNRDHWAREAKDYRFPVNGQ